jgi:molybdate transport system substrate-binding protein
MTAPAARRALALVLLVAVAASPSALVLAADPSAPPACPSPRAIPVSDPSPTGDDPDLVVFAAASLQEVIPAIAAPWSALHPGSDLVASFDASSTLRTQIEAGAAVDLFVSADLANPQALADRCLTLAGPAAVAATTLTIAVPAGNPAGITGIADLARPGLRIVATAPAVPIARYAAQVLAAAAAMQPDPPAWSAAVAANTVSLDDNVRAALARVELGEADASIVYVTDIAAGGTVEAVPIPAALNVTATYAAVVPGTAPQPALAAELLDFLGGPDAQAILASAGFLPPAVPQPG